MKGNREARRISKELNETAGQMKIERYKAPFKILGRVIWCGS